MRVVVTVKMQPKLLGESQAPLSDIEQLIFSTHQLRQKSQIPDPLIVLFQKMLHVDELRGWNCHIDPTTVFNLL